MKKILLFPLFIFFAIAGCSGGEKIESPVLVGPYGTRLWVSFDAAKSMCKDRVEYVKIKKFQSNKGKSNGPAFANDIFHNVYMECLAGMCDKDIAQVTEADKKYITVGKMQVLFLNGMADTALCMGKGGWGFYFKNQKGNIVKIGIEEDKYRITPDGMQILMSEQLEPKGELYADSYGKIYTAKDEKGALQVAEGAYFEVTLSDSKKLKHPVYMARSLRKGAKYCGEFDGILYIQK